jgi:hypothetical protein
MFVNGVEFLSKAFGMINKGKPYHYLLYNSERNDYDFKSCETKEECEQITNEYQFESYRGMPPSHTIPAFKGLKNENSSD